MMVQSVLNHKMLKSQSFQITHIAQYVAMGFFQVGYLKNVKHPIQKYCTANYAKFDNTFVYLLLRATFSFKRISNALPS